MRDRFLRTNSLPVEALPIYESPALREVTGVTIRPGGFTLTDRGLEWCNLTRGAMVLDIGCGLGATVHRLETTYGLKALGMDTSMRLLREGRDIHSSSSLMAGLAPQLPLRKKSLDCIFCECVLSILNHPVQALVEFAQALKPGGRLVITDLYARCAEGVSTLRQLSLNSCLKGAMPKQEILRLVKDAGFQTVLWEDHSHLLKQMAAKIVFEYGSMNKFWRQFAPTCPLPDLACGLRHARPGYYLMVAKKKRGFHE